MAAAYMAATIEAAANAHMTAIETKKVGDLAQRTKQKCSKFSHALVQLAQQCQPRGRGPQALRLGQYADAAYCPNFSACGPFRRGWRCFGQAVLPSWPLGAGSHSLAPGGDMKGGAV